MPHECAGQAAPILFVVLLLFTFTTLTCFAKPALLCEKLFSIAKAREFRGLSSSMDCEWLKRSMSVVYDRLMPIKLPMK